LRYGGDVWSLWELGGVAAGAGGWLVELVAGVGAGCRQQLTAGQNSGGLAMGKKRRGEKKRKLGFCFLKFLAYLESLADIYASKNIFLLIKIRYK